MACSFSSPDSGATVLLPAAACVSCYLLLPVCGVTACCCLCVVQLPVAACVWCYCLLLPVCRATACCCLCVVLLPVAACVVVLPPYL